MDLFRKCDDIPFGKQLQASGFDAYFRVLQSGLDTEVIVYGRRMLMLGSNDYLGLACEPRVKRAAAEAVEKWGAGTGGSRVLNGTLDLHLGLERRLARFLQRDDAIYYTSGYMTNLGVVSSLAQRGDVVVADRRAHASILDACRLSAAETKRFRHNDPADLARVLGSRPVDEVVIAIPSAGGKVVRQVADRAEDFHRTTGEGEAAVSSRRGTHLPWRPHPDKPHPLGHPDREAGDRFGCDCRGRNARL